MDDISRELPKYRAQLIENISWRSLEYWADHLKEVTRVLGSSHREHLKGATRVLGSSHGGHLKEVARVQGSSHGEHLKEVP